MGLFGGPEKQQTWSFRGNKSRNKVLVCEPACGSLIVYRLGFCLAVYLVNFLCGEDGRWSKWKIEMQFVCLGSNPCFRLRKEQRHVSGDNVNHQQLLARDHLALVTMKNAASCET
jgi:hypothetical protein